MTKPVNNNLLLEGRCIAANSQLIELYQGRVRAFGMSGKTMFYVDDTQHQMKVAQFATLLHVLVRPDDAVLDIGCGYGSLSPLLPNCRYLGIDLVPEFIAYAKQKYTLLDFQVLDVANYEGNYDWGILLGVVNSIPRPEILVELAWRKCKKGLLVDFVDRRKLPADFHDINRFDMGNCLAGLLELGTRKVEVHVTSHVWTIFVATKPGLWQRTRT